MTMNRFTKTGLLLFMLVAPVFLFLYLRFFGQNHYDLPRYHPVTDRQTGAVQRVPRANRAWYEPEVDTVFHQVPAFRLLDADNRWVTNAVTTGRIQVVSFVPERCGENCRRVLAQINRVLEVFYDNPAVLALTFTADANASARLRAWVDEYEARPDRWLFLRGTAAQVDSLLEKGYRFDAPYPTERQRNGKRLPASETFARNEKLLLVDKAGVIRGYYDGTDKKDVDRLILEIRVLNSTYQQKKNE
jgi:protein SCO1/2